MMRKLLLALFVWTLGATAWAVPATWTVLGGSITRTYTSGTGATETIPSNISSVIIEEWGGGGGGRKAGATNTGGGSGAYLIKSLVVTSSNWGRTFTYTVGTGGINGNSPGDGTSSTVVNGTFSTSFTGTAGGGQKGQNAGGTAAGGTATGGDTNTSGNSTSSATGGAAIPGRFGSLAGGGGNGGGTDTPGFDGQIVFSYQ